MTREDTDARQQERRQFRRLLWGYGFLGWGLGTGVLVTAAILYLFPVAPLLPLAIVLLLVCPLGGLVWAWLFWHGYVKHLVHTNGE